MSAPSPRALRAHALWEHRARALARAERYAKRSRRLLSRAVDEHEYKEPAVVTFYVGSTPWAWPTERVVTRFPLEQAPSFPAARASHLEAEGARRVALRYERAWSSA